MNGKPIGNNGETLDFTIENVTVYLAHVYFRNGDFAKSCDELTGLDNSNYCNLDCDPLVGWNNTNLDDLLDCLKPINHMISFSEHNNG